MFKVAYLFQLYVFCITVLPVFMTWHNECPTWKSKGEDLVFRCNFTIFCRDRMHFTTLCNLNITIWLLFWWKIFKQFRLFILHNLTKKKKAFHFSLACLFCSKSVCRILATYCVAVISVNPEVLELDRVLQVPMLSSVGGPPLLTCWQCFT